MYGIIGTDGPVGKGFCRRPRYRGARPTGDCLSLGEFIGNSNREILI